MVLFCIPNAVCAFSLRGWLLIAYREGYEPRPYMVRNWDSVLVARILVLRALLPSSK